MGNRMGPSKIIWINFTSQFQSFKKKTSNCALNKEKAFRRQPMTIE
jgi:hypothetical protein